MKKETWDAKHTINLVTIVAGLASVVLLAIFADGQHVTEVLAFVGGAMLPGSPLSTIVGKSE